MQVSTTPVHKETIPSSKSPKTARAQGRVLETPRHRHAQGRGTFLPTAPETWEQPDPDHQPNRIHRLLTRRDLIPQPSYSNPRPHQNQANLKRSFEEMARRNRRTNPRHPLRHPNNPGRSSHL